MVRAAIFDLDGLLVDSEPLWRRVQVEVFGALGLALGPADCAATTGLRIDEVVRTRYAWTPWEGPSRGEVVDRIVDRMVALVAAEGVVLPGAREAVETCRVAGLALALASSSHERLIRASLARLGLADAFAVVSSAERERWGKPHPAVFLTTLARLGVDPGEAVVFEDSLHGVIAAKAARARCVAVPAAEARDDPRFALADHVLASLEEVDPALLRRLGAGRRATPEAP